MSNVRIVVGGYVKDMADTRVSVGGYIKKTDTLLDSITQVIKKVWDATPPFTPISLNVSATAADSFSHSGDGTGDWGQAAGSYDGYNYGSYILYTWVYAYISINASYCAALRANGYRRMYITAGAYNSWGSTLYWSGYATIGGTTYTYANEAAISDNDEEWDGGFYDIPSSGSIYVRAKIGRYDQFGTSNSDWIRAYVSISFQQ